MQKNNYDDFLNAHRATLIEEKSQYHIIARFKDSIEEYTREIFLDNEGNCIGSSLSYDIIEY